MTPKEKAEELLDRFIQGTRNRYEKDSLSYRRAKQCALIAVDEIIESHLVLSTTHDLKPSIRCKRYWKEVKQEIEKL